MIAALASDPTSGNGWKDLVAHGRCQAPSGALSALATLWQIYGQTPKDCRRRFRDDQAVSFDSAWLNTPTCA